MSFISFFKLASMLAVTVATGGATAPMLTQMAMKVVVQMAIQKLGQELGLPPAFVNMIAAAVVGQMPGPAIDFNKANANPLGYLNELVQTMGPAEQGAFNRNINAINTSISNVASLVDNNEGLLEAYVAQRGWAPQYGAAMANFGGYQPQPTNFRGSQTYWENQALQAEARGDTAAAARYNARADLAYRQTSGSDQGSGSGSGFNVQDFLNGWSLENMKRKNDTSVDAILNGKGSIIMKLAVILGMIADQKMDDMANKARQIGNMGKINENKSAKFAQMNAELQALGQELGIISQALTNVLKSLGEAAQTMARKG